MASNTEVLKSRLKEIANTHGASIFSLGNYYMQFACISKDEIYAEAVSHNFIDTLSPSLEPSFRSLGYSIDDGNYYKTYTVVSDSDIDRIIDDCKTIFENYYGADINMPFEVADAE
jgi:hypothetical protein